jgi:N-acetylneuraminic acid mutarotase
MRHKSLLLQTIGGLILAALFLQACGTPAPPTPRMAVACAVVEGKVYVIGGIIKKGEITSVVEEYDPSADKWISRASMPTPRCMASAVTINKKIYVLGGRNESGITDAVEVYDPARDSWKKVTVMPQARWNHMVAELQGKLYVIGGIVGTGDSRRSIDKVQIYDPTTNSWKSGQSMPTSRQGAAIAVTQEKIYIIGGRRGAGRSGTATNIVEVYDPIADSWSSVEPAQYRRTEARAVVVKNRIYVIGGASEGEETGSIEMYDPANDTWVMMDLSLQEPRTSHCAVSLGNKVFVIGGATKPSLAGIVGTVEKLTVK